MPTNLPHRCGNCHASAHQCDTCGLRDQVTLLRDQIVELTRDRDEAFAKVDLLMQPKPAPILEAEQRLKDIEAALRFPWEMMRLWCVNRDNEKRLARVELERVKAERDELNRKLTIAQALLDGAYV